MSCPILLVRNSHVSFEVTPKALTDSQTTTRIQPTAGTPARLRKSTTAGRPANSMDSGKIWDTSNMATWQHGNMQQGRQEQQESQ
jgi:hypothetical protein